MVDTQTQEPEQQTAALCQSERDLISLTAVNPVDQTSAGKRFHVEVNVSNQSSQPISSDYPHRILLAYHWADSKGNYEAYEGLRTTLPVAIGSGEESTVRMLVKAPAKIGRFELQVGLIQERISWFETGAPQHLQKSMVEITKGESNPESKRLLPKFAEDRPIEVNSSPAIFSFELTNQCPFKCIMCARTNNMTRPEGNMSFATFKKAVDEFVEVNPIWAKTQDVWLHGFGESLVHPDFAKFMRYAVDKGVNAGLSINPLMLKKKVANDLLDAHPRHLYIPLDGHDNKTFERIRGVADAYDKSKQRLIKFLKEKERRGLDTVITLCMIDFPENRDSITELERFWSDFPGIDNFIAKPFVNWDGKAEDVNLLMGIEKTSHSADDKVVCDFPWRKMTVSWDGELVPCCFDYNKRYSLGNINDNTLVEIWNGEPMHALRQEFISNKVSNPLCEGCEYLYREPVTEA